MEAQPLTDLTPLENRRIPALDGIRALAILMVMYFHFWQQNWLEPLRLDAGLFVVDFGPLATCGFMGVELLFVLSGFLLFRPLAMGGSLSLKQHYWKRFIRIYPCYALCVLICGAVAYPDFSGLGEWLAYTAKNLLFLNTFSPELLFNRFNSVLWSTAVEVWFYLLFPLFALAMKRAPRATVLLTAAASSLYRVWAIRFSGDLPIWMNQLPGMLDCFVGGMFAAWAVAQAREGSERHRPLATVVSIAGGALFVFLLYLLHVSRGMIEGVQHYQVVFRPFFILAACLLVGGAALAPPLFQKVLGNRALGFVAGISYNLYLWHQWLSVKLRVWSIPPYATLDPHDDPTWQWQHMLLSFALSFAVAILATYAFERPVGKLLRGIPRRTKHER